MKIVHFIFYFILILLIFLKEQIVNATFLDNKAFYDLIEEASQQNYVNQGKKFVFFKIKEVKVKKKKKKMNYENYRNYLMEFLKSAGIVSEMYNWNNEFFFIITKIENIVPKEEILDRFKDVIESIGENIAHNIRENMRKMMKGEL